MSVLNQRVAFILNMEVFLDVRSMGVKTLKERGRLASVAVRFCPPAEVIGFKGWMGDIIGALSSSQLENNWDL